MDTRTQTVADLVLKTHHNLRKEMAWEAGSNNCAILAAMIGAAYGREITTEQYRACKAILKKNAGMFSEFRGLARPMVIAKMTLHENPEAYLQGSLEVYKKLRSLHKLTASPFMVMAAMTLYEHGGTIAADANIDKLENLYRGLKHDHPFLITDTDRGYLAILIASGCSIDHTVEEIERCYNASRSIALDKDAVHSLAQVLALSGKSTDIKTQNVKATVAALKKAHMPISKSYGLSAVGALELLDLSTEEKVQQVSDVTNYLYGKKGFRWYNDGKRIVRMYASLITLVAQASPEHTALAANINSTLIMTLIETLIITMIIAASAAASSAASSSH